MDLKIEMQPPDQGELTHAIQCFFTTVAGLVVQRSLWSGPERFVQISEYLDDSFKGDEMWEAFRLDESELSDPSVIALYEELIFFANKYIEFGRILNENLVLPGAEGGYDDISGSGSATGDDAVNDAGTVIGSIGTILQKLPGPVRKMLEAILEFLKLTRGG